MPGSIEIQEGRSFFISPFQIFCLKEAGMIRAWSSPAHFVKLGMNLR